MEEAEWILVGEAPAEKDRRRQVSKMLAEHDSTSDRRPEDVRIDLLCMRNDDLDAVVRVWVRRVPTVPPPRKKPRRKDGDPHG